MSRLCCVVSSSTYSGAADTFLISSLIAGPSPTCTKGTESPVPRTLPGLQWVVHKCFLKEQVNRCF